MHVFYHREMHWLQFVALTFRIAEDQSVPLCGLELRECPAMKAPLVISSPLIDSALGSDSNFCLR